MSTARTLTPTRLTPVPRDSTPPRWICSPRRSVPADNRGRDRMAFVFRLELADGTPADPPKLDAAVPNWRNGDTIHLGRRTLVVVGLRDDDADQPPVLIVEDAA